MYWDIMCVRVKEIDRLYFHLCNIIILVKLIKKTSNLRIDKITY